MDGIIGMALRDLRDGSGKSDISYWLDQDRTDLDEDHGIDEASDRIENNVRLQRGGRSLL